MAAHEEMVRKLDGILRRLYGATANEPIPPHEDLNKTFRLDMLDHVELSMALEEEFDIEITDKEQESLMETKSNPLTPTSIITFVRQKQGTSIQPAF